MKIPICTECRFCISEQEAFARDSTMRAGFRFYCDGQISPVTGSELPPIPCATARQASEVCGRDGRLFEAKK